MKLLFLPYFTEAYDTLTLGDNEEVPSLLSLRSHMDRARKVVMTNGLSLPICVDARLTGLELILWILTSTRNPKCQMI